ncbi:aspartyl/glutamyl-tRNA amidotransferase subunit A [Candidatus Pacearchaeota archaeon]|nr:aspartyl/glutamyl-tRNA amidotransferase subunit A [Candidatus Pacearchaeota archaeon]
MTTVEKLKKYLEEIKKNDSSGKKINSFLELKNEKKLLDEAKKIDEKIKSGKAGRLAGKIIGVKANLNAKGFHASCASKVLENYESTYDSTVVEKIKKEDGLIIGMLNMDEFASGSSGETSAFGPTRNPISPELIPGGSCSGPAAAVAADFCDMTLGTDTGGSIRNPASHCGIVGVKPTYGLVSRYGLIDLAMSFDTIGPLTKDVLSSAVFLNIIKGKDERDTTTFSSVDFNFNEIEKIPKKLKVAILDLGNLEVNPKIKEIFDKTIKLVSEKYGWETEVVKVNHIDLAVQTYYPVVYVESFSGTRKFDGRKYGKKIEEAVGPEFLRRILGGSEISKAEYGGRYYFNALRAKKIIEKSFEDVLNKYDCLVCPTVPRLPHKIGDSISVEEMYSYDVLTCPVNIAGNCAISIPMGKIKNIPIGMQVICGKFKEEKMFQIARSFEKSGVLNG